jgi:TRAP-type mannitol/chloroaromatic compound transport system permease small subunit
VDILRRYIKTIDSLSRWTGKIFCLVIIPLVGITIYEVVMRKFFNRPTIWVFEISNQLYGLHFMMGAAYALLMGAHVSVDVFYRYLSARGKAIVDVIGFLVFFFPFCIIILWKGLQFAALSWGMWETSPSAFHPALYPIKTIIPITAGLLLLQGLAVFLKKVHFALRGTEI